MSDNQSAVHFGCYGDKSIKTPHIDKLAKKGLILKMPIVRLHPVHQQGLHAHRSRHLSLGEAANLWSSFPKVKVYTQLMEASGYHVGIEEKAGAQEMRP